MTSDPPVSVLNHVVEICREGQQRYVRAASIASDAHLRKILSDYAEQRGQFALQLEALVKQLGAERDPVIQHRTWSGLQDKGPAGNESILDECSLMEDAALETFRTALSRDLPENARELLQAQCRQIEEVRVQIAELRAHLRAHPAAT